MRVTLVTETYFPQVNGVSRTLGQLVRAPDRTRATRSSSSTPTTASRRARAEHVRLVRSVHLPFYKELHLPLPPFGAAHRAIDAFRPDLVHIATEATLGLSRPASRRSAARIAGRLELPHELRPVQRPLRGRLGTGDDLALPAAGSTTGRGRPTSPRGRRSPSWRRGVRAAGALAAGRGRHASSAPTARAATRSGRRSGSSPTTS